MKVSECIIIAVIRSIQLQHDELKERYVHPRISVVRVSLTDNMRMRG